MLRNLMSLRTGMDESSTILAGGLIRKEMSNTIRSFPRLSSQNGTDLRSLCCEFVGRRRVVHWHCWLRWPDRERHTGRHKRFLKGSEAGSAGDRSVQTLYRTCRRGVACRDFVSCSSRIMRSFVVAFDR